MERAMVGGVDSEAELAAARLRMQAEQQITSQRERDRLRREEGEEQYLGRLLVLTVAAVLYVVFFELF